MGSCVVQWPTRGPWTALHPPKRRAQPALRSVTGSCCAAIESRQPARGLLPTERCCLCGSQEEVHVLSQPVSGPASWAFLCCHLQQLSTSGSAPYRSQIKLPLRSLSALMLTPVVYGRWSCQTATTTTLCHPMPLDVQPHVLEAASAHQGTRGFSAQASACLSAIL